MKRLGTILLACALILGMSQCKKENTNANAGSEQVYIELKVENGQRADVTPSTGAYDYNDGDKLLVGYNGAYKGFLVYDAETGIFSNTLDITQSGAQPLHFYYLNGQEPTETDNQYTFSISDQSAGLPVIAYAASRENFPSANGTYSAHLRNQCALVEFNTTATDQAITITGVKNQMTINFNGNTLTAGNIGSVTLYKPSGDNTKRYAILLPTEEEETTVTVSATGYQDKEITIGAIVNNGFIHDVAIELEAAAVSHVFTVDNQGHTVKFSPGNLQYRPSDGAWQFAAHQYEYIGSSNSSVSSSYTGWIDLFAFGTGNNPLNGSNGSYTDVSNDWGGYCGDPTGNNYTWRTLTIDEWEYLLTNSATRGDYPYLKANIVVNNTTYNGLILFPDNYGGSGLTGSYTYNNANSNYTSVSAEDWELMEAAGAVFFPAAGWRNVTGSPKTGFTVTYQDFGETGCYWSSTTAYSEQYSICFTTSILDSSIPDNGNLGYSVRLVRIL